MTPTTRTQTPARAPVPQLDLDAPWAMSSQDVAAALRVDPVAGLDPADAARRLVLAGPNAIPGDRRPSLWHSVGQQLRDAMILVLLAAGVLTLISGDLADTAVILLVVAVNTTAGVWQERRALDAVEALRSMTAPVATIRRSGVISRIPAEDVVPGDLMVLREGDVVPADGRLLTAHDLETDEALLTGESLPSARSSAMTLAQDTPVGDQVCMVHSGTLVAHGTGRAVVVATGERSCIGGISRLLHQARVPQTPLQRRLGHLGQVLSVVVVVACALVAVIGLLRGQSLELVLVTAISLAVAAIPESLPAVVVLSLSSGARRMARRGAIVRSLGAVETLGSVTVLASDKTGTLTTGEMVAVATWTAAAGEQATGAGATGRGPLAGGPDPGEGEAGPALARVLAGAPPGRQALLEAAALCGNADPPVPAPAGSGNAGRTGQTGGTGQTGTGSAGGGGFTELALVSAAQASGVDVAGLRRGFPRTAEVPFDRDRRDMSTTHRVPGGSVTITKGAPEAVLAGLADPDAALAAEVAERWAGTGRRVLALAAGPADQDEGLRLLGLIAIADPIRPGARAAIGAFRDAGITTVLITGDHPGTAQAVAEQTGLLEGTPAGHGELDERVFARADPATKLRLIGAWQDHGHVVAMTGDGVNDAPALRAADIGVAMGKRGTDVARGAADLVLTDDSLDTIVAAVAEGRRVFDNIRRFVRYGLSGGAAEIAVMLAGPLLGLPLPLLAGQILWINLLTHGLPGVAIGAEQAEPDVLDRSPRPPAEPILTRDLFVQILVLAMLLSISSLGVALRVQQTGGPWQSALFATLGLGQLGLALATRSDSMPIWRISLRGNRMLSGAVVLSVLLVLGALYLPPLQHLLRTTGLSLGEVLVVLAGAVLPALGAQAGVLLHRARLRRRAAVH